MFPVASLGCPGPLADRAGDEIGLATAMIYFEAPPTGYSVL